MSLPSRPLVLSRVGLVGRPSGAQPAGTPFFSSFIQHVLPFRTQLCWLVIGLGVALRGVHYLKDRSLWLDELMLALNVIHKPLPQLFQPLDDHQAAPFGFLLVEKLAVILFGESEFALRLFPFLCGVAAILLFYELGRRCLAPTATLIGLTLFALSGPFIYYSAEVKQYASDVTVALLLFVMALPYVEREHLSFRYAVLFGIVGALSLWFSHPAVLVLAGIGTTLACSAVLTRNWERIGQLVVVGTLWVLSFGGAYLVTLHQLSHDAEFLRAWNDSFVPLIPQSTTDLTWFVRAFLDVFDVSIGLPASLAMLAILVGGYVLFIEKKTVFLLLLSPVFFTLLASGLQKYPFSGRFLLFLVPAFLLIIATGAAYTWDVTKQKGLVIGITFVGLLVMFAGQGSLQPRNAQEVKPLLSYFADHRQAGDVLYVYYNTHYALRYYQGRYGLTDEDYIVGVRSRENWNRYREDLAQLRGHPRVWVLFSHVYRSGGVSEEPLFLYYLNDMGVQQDARKAAGAALYLYDLATPPDEQVD
jgi:uncharacterized membrane protein